MTWRETDKMDERLRFIAGCLAEEETMSALCEAFGISRKTGYKWLERYRSQGAAGLCDLPRAPHFHGRATAVDVVERIVAEKEAHPLWGPKKIVARLRRRQPDLAWPAASTAGEILKRHGLVKGRGRARWKSAGNGPWPEVTAPNAVWTADHKGWFRTGDRWRCEPLTVMDAKSRYMLGLEAVGSTAEAEAWPVFERLFDEYGLPDRLRSDNGSPFAGVGIAGLTPLAVRFVKLGIGLERIDPGKPQQNGRHERFHLTLLPLAKQRTVPSSSAPSTRSAANTTRSDRTKRSARRRPASTTERASGSCRRRCRNRTILRRRRCVRFATAARSNGMAAWSMSRRRSPAKRSRSRRRRAASGRCAFMPIRLASSTFATRAR
jgi:transposase